MTLHPSLHPSSKVAVRQAHGHGDEIAAAGTAKLKCVGLGNRIRRQAEQAVQGREAARMILGKCMAFVRDFVVAGLFFWMGHFNTILFDFKTNWNRENLPSEVS